MLKLATLVATARYESQVGANLSFDDQSGLEFSIAAAPEAHPVVAGTGGVRKARWARPGMGKRGGIRVIYYWIVTAEIVILLAAYPKNEKENLTNADKKAIREAVAHLERQYSLSARAEYH